MSTTNITVPGGSGSAITGEIKPWSTATAPSNWLLCDGTEYSTSDPLYTALYAVIGVTFGSGAGTFKVPDLRGRVPIGADNMGGTPANRVTNAAADVIGGNSGYETHTLITSELAAHGHTVSASIIDTPGDVGLRNLDYSTLYRAHRFQSASGSGSAGSDTAHNNMQPYLTVSYIIKT